MELAARDGYVLPIILGESRVALAGAGEGLARRHTFLVASGLEPEPIAPDISADALAAFRLLFVTGLSQARSASLAATGRAAGVLVNVEDQPGLCDFHVPAVVRRGDLLISVSTSGKSPGLAKLIREWIERAFPSAWAERLEEASSRRAGWRGTGAVAAQVAQRTSHLVEQRGWLP